MGALMTFRWMVVALAITALAGAALISVMSAPCSGDLTGSDPALEHRQDMERDSTVAASASLQSDAIAQCGLDAACITRVNEDYARFEADALRAQALDHRAALVEACRRRQ